MYCQSDANLVCIRLAAMAAEKKKQGREGDGGGDKSAFAGGVISATAAMAETRRKQDGNNIEEGKSPFAGGGIAATPAAMVASSI